MNPLPICREATLAWASLAQRFPASSVGASLSWAPAVLGLFHTEVVSAMLYPSHGTIDVMRVYVPWFFVSSHYRDSPGKNTGVGCHFLL